MSAFVLYLHFSRCKYFAKFGLALGRYPPFRVGGFRLVLCSLKPLLTILEDATRVEAVVSAGADAARGMGDSRAVSGGSYFAGHFSWRPLQWWLASFSSEQEGLVVLDQ